MTDSHNPEAASPEQNHVPPIPETPPSSTANLSTAPVASVGNRVVAVFIDTLVGFVISLVPLVGWIVTIAYFITRDALPFLDGQSIGKKVMKLRAVDAATLAPLTNNWGASAIRNVVLYIPFFAFVELFVLISNKTQRLGDQWAKTKVLQVG